MVAVREHAASTIKSLELADIFRAHGQATGISKDGDQSAPQYSL